MVLTILLFALLLFTAGYHFILREKISHLKKKTVDELLTEEDMFRLILGSIRDYAIFMIDPNGIVISWNEGASRIKGYTANEIIGQNMSVFYTDKDIENGEPEQNLELAERAGHFEKDGWRKRKDGRLFWANIIFTALYDEQKKLKGFAKITRDISERKKMEEQLLGFNQKLGELVRLKTAELTNVFERVSDGVIAFDNADHITYANKKTGEINKRKPEDLIGKNFWVEFPLASNPEFYKNYRKSIEEQQNVHFEMFTPALDMWIENFMYPSSDGMSLFYRDINQRKKLEESLKHTEEMRELIMNSSLDSIICFDKRGIITGWNQQAEKVFGWMEVDMKGKQLIDNLIPLRYRKTDAMEFKKLLQVTVAPYVNRVIEITVLHQSGKEFPIEFTIAPIKQNEHEFFCAFIRDNTERKRAEHELKLSTENLKHSYEDVRHLASNLQDIREKERAAIAREIHDELGQQLTALKIDISWVSRKLNLPVDGQIKEKIDGTLQLLDVAIKTVRKIATDLRPSILDELGLIAAIEWQSEEFQKRTGIITRFTTDIADFKFPAPMAIGLFRICQESLTNIARYAEAKNAFIALQQKDHELRLIIIDNGKGFDMEKISQKKTLGLLGMKERTLMMGGSYKMISGEGEGTSLFISIPCPVLEEVI